MKENLYIVRTCMPGAGLVRVWNHLPKPYWEAQKLRKRAEQFDETPAFYWIEPVFKEKKS